MVASRSAPGATVASRAGRNDAMKHLIRLIGATLGVAATLAQAAGGGEAGPAGAPPPAAAAAPPNLVVILADDLGYGDLGCYGNKGQRTPALDRLAAAGARFTDFYVSSPVCTPTRVALLTGRNPFRVGFSELLWPSSTAGLPASEVTLAELLKQHGYATACVGKWHLGHSRPEQLPLGHGFDSWYGMPYPNDMGPGHPVEQAKKETWPPMPMYRGTEMVEVPVDVNLLTQQYTAEAVRFIAENHHRPFFLYLAQAMPHSIVGASPDFRGKSENGLYGDAVEELDWSVGEIVRILRACGLEGRTLIFFTSDNGAGLRRPGEPEAIGKRHHPDGTYGSNGPLRGGKQTTFEGGIRVPGIFCWQGRIPAGQTVAAPADICDILPTFAEFAGVPLPAGVAFDGRSLVAPLLGTGQRAATDLFFGSGTITAARSGNWKVVLPKQPDWAGLDGDRPQLFDLAKDIGEQRDLAAEHPDVVAGILKKIAAYPVAGSKGQ